MTKTNVSTNNTLIFIGLILMVDIIEIGLGFFLSVDTVIRHSLILVISIIVFAIIFKLTSLAKCQDKNNSTDNKN